MLPRVKVDSAQRLRRTVVGADGVEIGLLTAGSGPAVLLVHGSLGSIDSWQPVWGALADQFQVTAMDRRGRETSGDTDCYTLEREYADVAAVAAVLADEQGGPVDVVGHSYGATCVLGAAARGAPFRRVLLYEPPGPQTVGDQWPERIAAMVADGRAGRAVLSFLITIGGLALADVATMREAPDGRGVLPIAVATLPREVRALAAADLAAEAARVRPSVQLLLGTASPPWAAQITAQLAAALPSATVTELAGAGHLVLDTAPDLLALTVTRLLRD